MEKDIAYMVSPIYARKAAPTARKRPPIETKLAAAAPVDSGTLAEEAPLAPPEAVEDGPLPEPVPEAEPLLGRAELAIGTLVLPEGRAVGEIGDGKFTGGTELATGGRELSTGTELATSGTELVASLAELSTTGAVDGMTGPLLA